MALTITQPDSVAALGEKIYQEKLKTILEPGDTGKFVAIEVNSARYFVAESSNEALQSGINEIPDGIFHLIKIGAPTAFTLTAVHRHANTLVRPHRRGWSSPASA